MATLKNNKQRIERLTRGDIDTYYTKFKSGRANFWAAPASSNEDMDMKMKIYEDGDLIENISNEGKSNRNLLAKDVKVKAGREYKIKIYHEGGPTGEYKIKVRQTEEEDYTDINDIKIQKIELKNRIVRVGEKVDINVYIKRSKSGDAIKYDAKVYIDGKTYKDSAKFKSRETSNNFDFDNVIFKKAGKRNIEIKFYFDEKKVYSKKYNVEIEEKELKKSSLDLYNPTTSTCEFEVELSKDFNQDNYKKVRITSNYNNESEKYINKFVYNIEAPIKNKKDKINGVIDNGMSPGKSYELYAYAQAKNGIWYLAGKDNIKMDEKGESDLRIIDIKSDSKFKVKEHVEFKVRIKNKGNKKSSKYKLELCDRKKNTNNVIYRREGSMLNPNEEEVINLYMTVDRLDELSLSFYINGSKSKNRIMNKIYEVKRNNEPRVVSFDKFISDLKRLNRFGKEFVQKEIVNNLPIDEQRSINDMICDFMRVNQYDGFKWQATLKPINQRFINYIKEKDLAMYDRYTGVKIKFRDKSGELVEIKHAFATLQGYISMDAKTPKSWYGWAGDLATLSVDINKKCKSTDSFKVRKVIGEKLMGTTNCTFPRIDLISDLDGALIAKEVKKSKYQEELFNLFYEYYLKKINRKKLFIQSITGKNSADKEEFIKCIESEVSLDNVKGKALNKAISLGFGKYGKKDMEVAIIAFVNYIFNKL